MTVSFLASLAAFAGYLLLAPAVSGMGDSSEFTLVLATNGVAHPTGYPLYTLLGHLFCRLLHAIGVTWAFAANAWSALGAAVAVYFLHQLALRLAERERGEPIPAGALAALVPAALLALNPVFLIEATSAEVNSWSVALTCAAGYCFADSVGALAAGVLPARVLRVHAARWGTISGLALAHHLGSVLVVGPLTVGVVLALARERRLAPGAVGLGGAALLVPLLGYGIILWRAFHPVSVQWPGLEPSLRSVWEHVAGAQYRHFFGYFRPAPDQLDLLARFIYPFLFAGLALLAADMPRVSGLHRRLVRGSLLASALLVTGFAFRYGVVDPAPYFLPGLALALSGFAPFAATLVRSGSRAPAARYVGAVVVALAVIAMGVVRVRENLDRRRELESYERDIRAMWTAIPADTTIILWPDDRYVRLQEYQVLRGERRGAYVTNPDMLLADPVRRGFITRFGFDPLEGLRTPYIRPGSPEEPAIQHRFLMRVVDRVARGARVPVIWFDPSVPVVRRIGGG